MIKVLVVEDDPMVMDITCKYVESIPGFQVAGRAADSLAAKELLDREAMDLIILDVFMPGMNGVELLSELRKAGNLSDVIFLTAANDTQMINVALKLGLVDYLIKPFNYERFKASLVNYQKIRDVLRAGDKTTQEQLDSAIKPLITSESARIHKGMHPKTLEGIREYVASKRDDETITQQEIMENLGLSRVTVRKYMEYLASTNEVTVQMEYGTVGRPSYIYKKMG